MKFYTNISLNTACRESNSSQRDNEIEKEGSSSQEVE